jgi:transposase
MRRAPERVTLTSAAGEALIERVYASDLPRADCTGVVQSIRLHFWRMLAIQEAKLRLKRFRQMLFGEPATRRSEAVLAAAAEAEKGEHNALSTLDKAPERRTSRERGGHRPGQGRLGAEAYVGAERTECRHEELAVGQRCPGCGQGPLYELPPGVEMRIDGHALLSAMRYEMQKLRCSAWGQIFTASLPREAGEEKDSARARAVLAVCRYYLGLPFYRLQGYQARLGVPVPDATQWEQIEKGGDWSSVVFASLETWAAQGELIYPDATSGRILTLLKATQEIQARAAALGFSRSKERTGMFTTALVVKVGERIICLYYSGRSHAGENLAALLEQRQADQGKPFVMSDALSRNEVNEAAVIRCHCLAHGRRQFSDLEETFPLAGQVVLGVLQQVCDHDEETRQEQRSAAARLAYHQDASRPLMDELKEWLDKQVDDRLVEPNRALGQAIAYRQGHWTTLTRFFSVPGAPLDNHLVERALKLCIRQRNNALFSKSESSAYSASVLTSLIAPCL